MNTRRCLISFTALVVLPALVFSQAPASKIEAGAYLIPFETEGNRIELMVSNETDDDYQEVRVNLVDIPSWLQIDEDFNEAESIDADSEQLYTFVFSVDDSAPTEEVASLEFEVRAGEELITTKTIDIAVELPKELVLRGNYPNPFNPSTTIGFVQPEDGDVTLDIFDAVGRRVDRLSKYGAKQGQQTFGWNATSRATGVYFYRLQLQSERGVKETRLGKMLLIK